MTSGRSFAGNVKFSDTERLSARQQYSRGLKIPVKKSRERSSHGNRNDDPTQAIAECVPEKII